MPLYYTNALSDVVSLGIFCASLLGITLLLIFSSIIYYTSENELFFLRKLNWLLNSICFLQIICIFVLFCKFSFISQYVTTINALFTLYIMLCGINCQQHTYFRWSTIIGSALLIVFDSFIILNIAERIDCQNAGRCGALDNAHFLYFFFVRQLISIAFYSMVIGICAYYWSSLGVFISERIPPSSAGVIPPEVRILVEESIKKRNLISSGADGGLNHLGLRAFDVNNPHEWIWDYSIDSKLGNQRISAPITRILGTELDVSEGGPGRGAEKIKALNSLSPALRRRSRKMLSTEGEEI